jgi:hypothetical protein
MADKPSNQFDGEFAALRHTREMEALGESGGVGLVVDAAISIGEKFGLPACFGMFRRALKQGQPSAEKMVDDIEAAAFEEVRRIWEHLNGQKKRQEEFEARLHSQEAQTARLSALFHGLRTSDPKKHFRLGRLTINCIFADDLKPESLDDMMRAAVELNEADIVFLERIYAAQILSLNNEELTDARRLEQMIHQWPNEMPAPVGRETTLSKYRSSVARLQAHALIQFRTPGSGQGGELVFLLKDGARFHERFQEIAV